MSSETILAVPAGALRSYSGRPGLHFLAADGILSTLSAAGLWFGPRWHLEQDEDFRQVVPYIVLDRSGFLLSYLRSPAGSEGRLHGRRSIGVGGHVNLQDVRYGGDQIDLGRTLGAAASREVGEELGEVPVTDRRWLGLLVDDSTAVSRVHVGVVGLWTLGDGIPAAAEHSLADVTLVEPAGVDLGLYETWSAMVLSSPLFAAAGVAGDGPAGVPVPGTED